jgi:hypothetical protein
MSSIIFYYNVGPTLYLNTSPALELFELQPIGASSVGVYEQMQRNLQADNPTLAPQIDSRKPANQEIL